MLPPVVSDLVDLVLPATCAGCGTAGALLCAGCRSALEGPARVRRPDPVPPGLPEPWSVADYAGPVRAAVVAAKERGTTRLARPLGNALARAVRGALGAPDALDGPGPGARRAEVLLVPAPSRPAARRERGHDPTLRMARRAVAELRGGAVPVRLAPVLRVGSGVADQAGLTAYARAENLAGAFRVPARLAPLVSGRTVLLLDDVVTTGATLAEMARALRRCGALVAAAATVAATARRASSEPAGHRPG